MANDLVVGGGGVLTLFTKGGSDIGDVLRPLTKEIFLYDTYIAGTTHLDDGTILDEVAPGDQLILQRENNRYDERAILVLNSDMKKLGYIPEKDNTILSRLMDAGKCLTAKVSKKDIEGWFVRIGIKIYMVDF